MPSLLSLGEFLCVVLGLVSVAWLARGDGRGWPLGAVMVLLSGWVFWESRLWGQAALSLVFLVAQLAGWRRWVRGMRVDLRQRSRRLTWAGVVAGVTLWLAGTWPLAHVLEAQNGRLVWWDALATSGSLLAQGLIVAGFAESWLIYLVVDLVLVALSWRAELPLMAVMYSVYCGLAWQGWREWTRDHPEGARSGPLQSPE